MELKLGKRPARKGAISFQFADYFDLSSLPKPPMRIGHEKIGADWGVLANDEFSCCVFSGAAHEHMVWTHTGFDKTCRFTDENVLADYGAVTGFNRNDPGSDQGTDMASAAKYRRTVGVVDADGVRHKIDSYVALRPGNVDHLALAVYLTGGIGIGLMMPEAAMDQFEAQRPWQPVAKGGMAGGHYVPCIGRNTRGDFLIITWGRIHAMSPGFYQAYNDESVAYLSLETIRGKVTPEGFDEATLRSHLAKLAKT